MTEDNSSYEGTGMTREALESLADDFESGRLAMVDEDLDEVRGVDEELTGSAPMTIRLPRALIARLKTRAVSEGVPTTVLARRLLTTAVAADPASDVVITQADVWELFATRGKHLRSPVVKYSVPLGGDGLAQDGEMVEYADEGEAAEPVAQQLTPG